MLRHGERLGAPISSQSRVRRLGGFFELIPEGEAWPRRRGWRYGFVWRDFGTMRAWCCPIPFNWPIGWLRNGYWWVCWGPRRQIHYWETELAQANEAVKRFAEQVLDLHAERSVLVERLAGAERAHREIMGLFLAEIEDVPGLEGVSPEDTAEIRTKFPPQEPPGAGKS